MLGAVYLYFNGAFSRDSIIHLFTRLPVGVQSLNPYKGETQPIHIAIIIPENQKDAFPVMKNSGMLFEKKVNDMGGVNGHNLLIDFYLDGDDSKDEALAAAQQVVQDNRALVVIGHRTSASSKAVAPIYDEAGIPTINAGASAPNVTQDRPWAFRVINDTTDVGKYAALYAHDVMGYETASIVHENDTFGTSLADAFQSTFEKAGGTIIYKQSLTPIKTIDEESLNIARDTLNAVTPNTGEKPGIVFFAVSRATGQQLVTAKSELKKNIPILASYAMGDINFARVFDNPSILDGFNAMSLLNYDVAGEQAQIFYNDYSEMFPDATPSWLGGTTYDALQVALRAIDETNATGNNLKNERENIKNYLTSINNPNMAVSGVRGQIYFDSNHNFSLPPTFGYFQNGNYIPALIQLLPVPNNNLVTEITDDIIVDGNKYIYKTKVAYTGIHLNEINDVDVDQKHIFTADFYIWFRYQGDLDIESIDFLNAVTPIKLGDTIKTSTTGNINYKLYRVRGQFHTTFDLQKYPFDKQELLIQFRHRTLSREELIYVEDTLGMDNITHGDDLLTRFNSEGVFASVSDWSPANPRIFIDIHSNRASFGNPALIGNQQSVENSTFNMKIDIERNYSRFMLKNLLPLFCLVALAYVSLFLPGYKFETIISVMTGSVLSIVFFHVNLSNRLNVGYNVALDYVFYGTYLLFILELMIVVRAWHYHQPDEKMVRNRLLFARILYPAYIIIAGGLFLWFHIN